MDTSFYPAAQPNKLTDTASGVLGIVNQSLDARQKHMDLVKGQVDYLANGLGALASKGDLSQQDLLDFGHRAVQEGILDPQTFAVEMQQVQQAGNDPAKLHALATEYQLRALDAGQKFTAQFGTAGTVDTGGFIQPVTQSPLTGMQSNGAPIEKTLTPQDLATQTTVPGPDGTPVAGTVGQALGTEGLNPLTAKPVAAPQGGNPLTGATAPPAPAAPAGPLPVGATEAATATGKASGDQLANDRLIQSNYQQTILPLTQAIAHIDALPDNATGPGSEDINTIQSFLQTMGIKTDPQKVADFDELKKYLTNIGRSNGNTGTNDQLAAAISGSPGTTVSTLANKDILRTLLGMARFQAAKVSSFDQTGQGANTYSKYASSFNTAQDPRAYSFDLMKPEDRAKLIEGLSPTEKAKFVNSLRNAVALGFVVPPNG